MTIPTLAAAVLVAAVLAAPAAAQPAPAAASTTGFQLLDADGDGLLSRYEYDGDNAFAVLDANGDRRLSADELDAVLGRVAADGPTAAERIVVADLDRDGQLDENELRGAAEMRFTSMDRNGDGNVDPTEFAAAFGVRAR
ncbi:EF-hand domain-containing protein [Pseudoxanthomonas sp. 10H]|uniref:EF-hand domain-containing protein n=1 Tax=Pseudoxanthomonas sp. 10H TaxID=3242729 RepID=UPI003556D4F5